MKKDFLDEFKQEAKPTFTIEKRDGRVVEFDGSKIVQAVAVAIIETEETDLDLTVAESIAEQIEAERKHTTVYEIENRVIELLYSRGLPRTAEAYSEYKTRRAVARANRTENRVFLSDEFLSSYKHRQEPFKNELGRFVYYRTYSRPVPEENRRERWWETVARVVEFSFDLQTRAMHRQGKPMTPAMKASLVAEAEETYDMMYNLKLFPSGRSLWVGGTPSSYIYPLSNFNCSFVTIDQFDKFSEIFFVLMLGTGVGLSVERKYVSQLPPVNVDIEVISKSYEPVPVNQRKEHTQIVFDNNVAAEIIIGDSKSGWAEAIRYYFDMITSKQFEDLKYIFINYNNVRPAGERLKTFGGYASGHVAIQKMFEKIDAQFENRSGGEGWYKLRPIDALDIATIIAENVVSGGTRRSAEIIFCDPDETEVLEAKANIYQEIDGEWVANQEILHRFLSNNTVFYSERPSKEVLSEQFNTMRYSGEPAIANFSAMQERREDVQGGNPLTY